MKLVQYLKESKKETTNYTLAVIFISLGLAAFFAIVDFFLSKGLEQLISK